MNYFRTAMLLAGLTALFMGVGYLIGGLQQRRHRRADGNAGPALLVQRLERMRFRVRQHLHRHHESGALGRCQVPALVT